MTAPLCCNCCKPLVYDAGRNSFLHLDSKLPQCTFRDSEQQVNAQKKVHDVRKMERRLGLR